jgi:hypothetical protein
MVAFLVFIRAGVLFPYGQHEDKNERPPTVKKRKKKKELIVRESFTWAQNSLFSL